MPLQDLGGLGDTNVAYNQVAPTGYVTEPMSNGLDGTLEEIPLPQVENNAYPAQSLK